MDDKLRELARQAVAGIDPDEHPRSIRLHAVWDLREADGAIVASQSVVFLKDHQVPDRPWSCTDGGHAPDEEIDRYLGLNARVLRVGTGED